MLLQFCGFVASCQFWLSMILLPMNVIGCTFAKLCVPVFVGVFLFCFFNLLWL